MHLCTALWSIFYGFENALYIFAAFKSLYFSLNKMHFAIYCENINLVSLCDLWPVAHLNVHSVVKKGINYYHKRHDGTHFTSTELKVEMTQALPVIQMTSRRAVLEAPPPPRRARLQNSALRGRTESSEEPAEPRQYIRARSLYDPPPLRQSSSAIGQNPDLERESVWVLSINEKLEMCSPFSHRLL